MLPAFLTTVLFSISAVSANRLTQILGGIAANFYRITVATALLAVWAHTAGDGLSGPGFVVFLISGLVGFGIGDLALYQALPRLGSRLSVLLVHCLASPFAAITEWLWLGTELSGRQILWSATILVGVSIALAPGGHLQISRRTLQIGVTFGALAAFGQGFGAVLSRKAYQLSHQAGAEIDGLSAAYQRILAGWAVAGLALIIARQFIKRRAQIESGDPQMPTTDKLRLTWHWILINALSGPTLGVGCYQWALATQPTGIVLPIVALTPLVVIPFVRYMEGEQPSRRSLLGGLVAVIGAVALTIARTR